jgi:diguanylate cyclase (GGDEF)-like protein
MGLERAALEAAAARREAEALRDQAQRDWLTGLHNRRFLAAELDRLEREVAQRPYSVAMLDLDHFKAINDRHGHEVGDRVLKRLAELLVGVLRSADDVVRVGGEEFVVLMGDTDGEAAAAACERVCQAVRDEDWGAIAPGLAVTVSVGVASALGTAAVGRLTELADQRLYAAKRAGRDRVVAGARAAV